MKWMAHLSHYPKALLIFNWPWKVMALIVVLGEHSGYSPSQRLLQFFQGKWSHLCLQITPNTLAVTDVAVQLPFHLQTGPQCILPLKASLSFLWLEVFSCWRGKTGSLSKLLWTSVILLGPVRHHRTNSPGSWVKDFSKTKVIGINLNPDHLWSGIFVLQSPSFFFWRSCATGLHLGPPT